MTMPHAIVVGASRGLGEAVGRDLAGRGWQVTLGARSILQLQDIADELCAGGMQVQACAVDVRNADSVRDFFRQSCTKFGRPLGLVHAAARYGPFGAVLSVNEDDWTDAIETNLYGTFLVLREAGRQMRETGHGRIVVLSGGGATAPLPTLSAYAASKAAVVRLVETFALEMEDSGIRVNALAPGLLQTQMLDELLAAGPEVVDPALYKRMLAAKESGEDSSMIAVEAIRFLLSSDVDGMTGRLIAAKWDSWHDWIADPTPLSDRDAFTLRRQIPHS
jgi:NAD(P)-dependent dehydrogenase (short-subunit alcohol dehydrogenase family)